MKWKDGYRQHIKWPVVLILVENIDMLNCTPGSLSNIKLSDIISPSVTTTVSSDHETVTPVVNNNM